MIIGKDLLLELKLDLCFSDYTIRGNGGLYKVCTVSMKYPSIFINEDLWQSEHVLDST